jgi:two-component system sensor histidine kinase BaeS
LSILKGQVEALEDGIRPFDLKAIKLLGGEVNRLGKLVDDLFQLSLSDLGALSYSKEPLNLSHLVEVTMDHFEERLAIKELDLQISLTRCSKVKILADPQRLRQSLINIVENSIRYTDAGGCIKVSCNQQGRSVFLRLEDSTPSVPPQQLGQLFQRLYRGESSRNRKTGGAGLGLTIVKAIIEAHEASITAKHSSLGGLLLELKFPIIPKT